MSANYYLGADQSRILGDNPRFFYALRRNDDGELYFIRIDQLTGKESVDINLSGETGGNLPDFEQGFNYFEGIDSDHNIVYDNLYPQQYKWDNRSIFYYVNEQGQFVERTNQSYPYPDQISK